MTHWRKKRSSKKFLAVWLRYELMKPWLITLISIVAIAVVVGAGYLGLRQTGTSDRKLTPTPITVPVTRGEVQHTVTAPGQVVGTGEVLLGMPVDGRLTEIKVRAGSVVRAEAILAQLDAEPLLEAVTQAQLRLDLAQKEHQQRLAEADLALQIAEARLKQAQLQQPSLSAARAALTVSQADLRQIRAGPNQDEITAAAADLRRSEVNLKAAQQAYDQVAYVNDIGATPEAVQLETATLDYESTLAAYNLAIQGPTESDLIRAQANVQQAQANVQATEAEIAAYAQTVAILEVEVAQARLTRTHLQAGGDPQLLRDVEKAKKNLAEATLTAPFDGVVVEVFVKPGERVSGETNLMLFADPRRAEVRVKVIEEDLPLIQIDQPATLFFDAEPLEIIPGRVRRIVPKRIEGEDRPLYFVFIAPDHLPTGVVSGMTTDASIIIERQAAALRLPRALVRPNGQGVAIVPVWDSNQTTRREVEVGLRGDVYVEIIAGLNEGEQILAE